MICRCDRATPPARGNSSPARPSDLTRLGDPVAAAAALGDRASLEAAARMPRRRRVALPCRACFGRRSGGTRGDLAAACRPRCTLRDQGAIDDAAQELRAAIADIERTGRSLTATQSGAPDSSPTSGTFMCNWRCWSAPEGRVGAAFEVSERIRAGEMLELLGQGRICRSS